MAGKGKQVTGRRSGYERACERVGKYSASANADSERQRGGLMSELSIETPDEDAAEQAREVPEGAGEELSELPFEVDEADATEQIRDAGYDDEDYR